MPELIAREFWQVLRRLWWERAFSATVILTLTVAIGVCAGVFSVVNVVLLKPLPYPEPDRIAYLGWEWQHGAPAGTLSPIKFEFAREYGVTAFSALATSRAVRAEVSVSDLESWVVHGKAVSENWLDVLGYRPKFGRYFSAEEYVPGSQPVVVLGHSLWRRHWGASPDVLGGVIKINEMDHVVVGVLPDNYEFTEIPEAIDFLVPLRLSAGVADSTHNLRAIGRLRERVSIDRAQAEIEALSGKLRDTYPAIVAREGPGGGYRVSDFQTTHVGELSRTIWLVFGAVCLVLLIAVANIASMFMTRMAARRRELATRLILGARTIDVYRSVFLEAAILAVIGGAIGVVLASITVHLLTVLLPAMPRIHEIKVDSSVLLFSMFTTFSAAILFSMPIQVIRESRKLNEALKEGGAQSGGISRRDARGRGVLLTVQTTLATMLLASAVALVATLSRMESIDLGFEVENVYSSNFQRVPLRYSDPQARLRFAEEALDVLSVVPDFQEVAVTSSAPFRAGINIPVTTNDARQSSQGDVELRAVSPGYFATLGITITRGRPFTAADQAGAAPVAIVNQAYARRHFSDIDPVGERVSIGYAGRSAAIEGWEAQETDRAIVGVVADIREITPRIEPRPTIYIPYNQLPDLLADRLLGMPVFVVRSLAGANVTAQLMHSAIRSLDASLVEPDTRSLARSMAATVQAERSTAHLLTVYAGIALFLVAVGLSGLMGYQLVTGGRELGIRAALGATPTAIVWKFFSRGLRWVGFGLLVGLLLFVLLFGVLERNFGEVDASRLEACLLSVIVVLIVAGLSAYVPVRRVASLNPGEVLRNR